MPAYELFSCSELLGEMALERMLTKLSTRRVCRGAWNRSVGRVVAAASGTSKSAISRRFVAMTEHALDGLMSADLTGLDPVTLMADGVNFAEHCCVVALGIDVRGTKHPLAVLRLVIAVSPFHEGPLPIGSWWAKRHLRIRARSATGQVAGAATY